MTIVELKSQIMQNQLHNVYVFTGDEIGIINIYLNQMSKVLNMPITRADSVASIYSKCTTRSMFGNTVGFYVIRNDSDIMKEEKAYQTLSADIGKNVIVLLYDKIDSRLKFGKFFKDYTVQFEKLAPNILKSYIKKAIDLKDANIEKLMDLCSCSYDMCMLEIDKIKSFDSASDPNKVFQELLGTGAIYQPQENDVFQFTNAVCSRNYENAFKIADNLLSDGMSSIVLLGTLYSSLKAIMLIQCCEGDICNTTGLDNKQVYFNKKYCDRYQTSELVEAVKLISKTVDDIKNGYIDDSYATKYVLCKIM